MYAYQDLLVRHLKTLFPYENPQVNARKQVNLKYSPEDTHYLELDVWFPNYNICFEFQDEYHYTTTWYHQKSTSQVQLKDNKKKAILQQVGLTLIVIPCWWDCSVESLRSTISFQCPELLPVSLNPIPLNPSDGFFQSTSIQGVGELMYASFASDPAVTLQSDWWLGEKYDGIRCCWIPETRKVYSRFNNEITMLPSFLANVPLVSIDGELWSGRGSYSQVYKLIKKSLLNWAFLRITAFDYPQESTQKLPFEERYERLLVATCANSPCAIVVARFFWEKEVDIKWLAQLVLEHAGEGLIMRQVGSFYEHGRSLSLLKFKGDIGDSEGVVVALKPNFVHLQLPSGKMVAVPSENVEISNLAVGSVVTFSYETDTHHPEGLINPTIKRIRHDIVWQERGNVHVPNKSATSESSASQLYTKKPTNVWYHSKRRRQFFEAYAKINGFDPLHAAKWYTQKRKKIVATKGAHGVLSYHKFSVFRALTELFPEVKFNRLKFQWPALWREAKNRRKFFETYAREQGFNPLRPADWYLQAKKSLLSLKSVKQIISYHNNNIRKTLFSLFPEIGWNKSKLWPEEITWNKPQTIKVFLENYANNHGFDPKQPVPWYSHAKELLSLPEVERISKKYGGSIAATLNSVFPNLGIQKSRMNIYLPQKPLRRNLFENFAKRHKFDPLVPANWYSQSKEMILSVSRLRRVVTMYNGSMSAALLDLFPDIGLEKSKFLQMVWKDPSVRRNFFQNFARRNEFNPLEPEHWHATFRNLLYAKGANQVIPHHKNSMAHALMDHFPDIGLDLDRLLELERIIRPIP
eukprot:Phypoly_transcript_02892.p1 GENE.Phypoly_transcript_02892~~Phypoly_transcript_02892.p1  ORF type:complete len:806 (+),score=69.97 Phypoly_transcript_02892:73-2490(+)